MPLRSARAGHGQRLAYQMLELRKAHHGRMERAPARQPSSGRRIAVKHVLESAGLMARGPDSVCRVISILQARVHRATEITFKHGVGN